MTWRRSPGDLRALAARTVVVTAAALAVVSTAALIVVSAEVLLLLFAGLLFSALLSSAADALVRVSGLRRGVALALTVAVLVGAAVWDDTGTLALGLTPGGSVGEGVACGAW